MFFMFGCDEFRLGRENGSFFKLKPSLIDSFFSKITLKRDIKENLIFIEKSIEGLLKKLKLSDAAKEANMFKALLDVKIGKMKLKAKSGKSLDSG